MFLINFQLWARNREIPGGFINQGKRLFRILYKVIPKRSSSGAPGVPTLHLQDAARPAAKEVVSQRTGTSPAVVPSGHADGAGETPAMSSASPGAWEACPKCHHKTCRWELVGRKHDPTKEVPWFRCHRFAKCDYKVFGTSA